MLDEIAQPSCGLEFFRVELAVPPMSIIPTTCTDICLGHPRATNSKTEFHIHPNGGSMNTDILKGKWMQMKGDLRKQWAKLTDSDIDEIQGDAEKFIGKLQERYGYNRQQAEKEFNDYMNRPGDKSRRTA